MSTQHVHKTPAYHLLVPHFLSNTLEITELADKLFLFLSPRVPPPLPPSRTHTDRRKVAGSACNIKRPYTMANKQSLVDFRQAPRSASLCCRHARASGVVVLLLL